MGGESQAEDGAMNSTVREDEMNNGEYADATRPNEVGAVRSPQAAGRDYEVEQGRTGMTRNEDVGPAAPSIPGSVTYETTSPAGTSGTAPAPGYGSEADTATGYSAPGDTASDPRGLAGSRPGTTGADTTDIAAADAAVTGATVTGATAGGAAGKHAASAEDAGPAAR